jgi:ankyrin repeat protein
MPHAIHDPNYQGPFGNTLLHSAVVSGDIDEVRRLLSAGADPTIANRDGKTPLDAASLFGHQEIEELLGRHIQLCDFFPSAAAERCLASGIDMSLSRRDGRIRA